MSPIPVVIQIALATATTGTRNDPPDPVTLSEPVYDDAGRLRWSSLPLPAGEHSHG